MAGIKEDEEDTSPANAEMDGSSSNSDANVEGVVGHTTLAPLTPSAEPDTNSDCPHSLDLRVNSKEVSDSSITIKASSLENHVRNHFSLILVMVICLTYLKLPLFPTDAF